jgi:hypothetical protein
LFALFASVNRRVPDEHFRQQNLGRRFDCDHDLGVWTSGNSTLALLDCKDEMFEVFPGDRLPN